MAPLEDDFLPEIGVLERPEELTQRPPYRLVVRQEGRSRVVVEGSHMGSLRVLEGYLGRWVRHNVDFVDRVSRLFTMHFWSLKISFSCCH